MILRVFSTLLRYQWQGVYYQGCLGEPMFILFQKQLEIKYESTELILIPMALICFLH